MSATQASPRPVGATTLVVDTERSTATFTARGLFGKVAGTLPVTGGEVQLGADGSVASVRGTVDATGLDTANARRDAHLHSPDVLAVAQHPVWELVSREVLPEGDGWHVVADLTVRTGCPVQLRASAQDQGDGTWRVRAHAELDRRDAGVTALPRFMVGSRVAFALDVLLRPAP